MNPHKFSNHCIKKTVTIIKQKYKLFVEKILQISQQFFYMAMAD